MTDAGEGERKSWKEGTGDDDDDGGGGDDVQGGRRVRFCVCVCLLLFKIA